MNTNLSTKPSWLEFFTVDSGKTLNNQYGFDADGMWITGDSGGISYPVRTTFVFQDTDVCEVICTINHNDNCSDHSIALFNDGTDPIWSWGTNSSRIAISMNCEDPHIYGQSSEATGTSVSDPAFYTLHITYNPNTPLVNLKIYSGYDTNGSLLSDISINESLPSGNYTIGFDADMDGNQHSYFQYLEIKKNGTSLLGVSNTNRFNVIHPVYEFEVFTYTPESLVALNPLPDSLENLISNFKNMEVIIGNKKYKHGDRFTAYGKKALYFKKIFMDSPNPVLKFVEKNNYGSLYFDGSSNIVLDGNDDWAVGTGDFTIEWFQYQESSGEPYSRIFAVQPYPTTQIGASVEEDGDNFYAWIGGEGHGSPILNYINQWCHMAITRSGGTLKLFKDGTELNSFVVVSDITDNSNQLYIGSTSSGNYFKGYITNFNFVKGTALYTNTFTPPTAQISADANTKLLLLAASESEMLTDSSGLNKTITNNGATWSNLSPFNP